MCSINHDLKAIYIHVPKCGGSFVGGILKHYYDFENIRLPHETHKEFSSLFEKVVQSEGDNLEKVLGDNCDNNEDKDKEDENDDDYDFKDFCCRKSYGDPWTTTEQGILRYNSSSKLYNYVMEMTEDKWRDYKKFTIIRNPYDKFISAWKFINKCIKEKQKSKKELLDLDEYVNKTKAELYDYCKFAYSHSHITTYDHLIDVNNELHIDFIGSLENLNEDLCDILLKLGVDKIKHRPELEENKKYNANEHAAYIEYYDDSILEKVNEILQKDFDTFKQYKQVFTVEEMKEESAKYLVSEEEFNQKNKGLLERLEKDGLIVEKREKENENEKEKLSI